MAAEPKEVVLKSEGTPEAKPQLPDYKPVAGASLDKLIELENALKQSITNLAITDAAVKAELTQRITNDIKVLKEASIEELNDAKDNAPLYDKSKNQAKDDPNKTKGLVDRQEATRKQIENKIKDAAEKDRILGELEAVHNIRRTILDRRINLELNAKTNYAYRELNSTLGTDNRSVEATSDNDAVPKVTNKLQADLAKSHQQTIIGQGDKKVHFTNDTNATSNDPKALGAAMVAKGLTNIKFSGHPENALIAAEEALRCGADGFELDDATMKALNDEKGYAYYSNPGLFKVLTDKYEHLQKIAAANRYAKSRNANTVFNAADEVSPQQNIMTAFGQLGTPQEHSMYLNTLTGEQQAQLAMGLMEHNRAHHIESNYKLSGLPKTEYQYIAEILQNQDEQNRKANRPTSFYISFHNQYAKLQTDDKKLADFRAGTNAVAMGNSIADIQDINARVRYYQEIDKLDNPATNKNEVRAACLGAIIDRTYKYRPNDPESAERQAHNNNWEIAELLKGTKPEERREIRNLFDHNFNRAKIKLASIAPGSTLKDPPSNFALTPDQWKAAPEGVHSTNLLKSKADFMLYRNFVGKAYHALNVIDQQPGLVEKKNLSQEDPDTVILSTSPRVGA